MIMTKSPIRSTYDAQLQFLLSDTFPVHDNDFTEAQLVSLVRLMIKMCQTKEISYSQVKNTIDKIDVSNNFSTTDKKNLFEWFTGWHLGPPENIAISCLITAKFSKPQEAKNRIQETIAAGLTYLLSNFNNETEFFEGVDFLKEATSQTFDKSGESLFSISRNHFITFIIRASKDHDLDVFKDISVNLWLEIHGYNGRN